MAAQQGKYAPAAAVASQSVRRIDLRDLLEGRREVVLVHEGHEYRLRITSKGKLILTK